MKKTFFSFGLYKEGMKQLRAAGIIGFILMMAFAVIGPVSTITRYMSYENEGYVEGVYRQLTYLVYSHSFVVTAFMIFAPLLVLILFHFMNKRDASDFYYAFPQNRSCLFLSYFAAVMTWLTVMIVVSSLVNLGIMALFPQYFSVDWGVSMQSMFNIWSATLYVAASVAIAMAITGTVFSNVIVSGIIIFIPRMLIKIMVAWTVGTLPFIDDTRLPRIFDEGINVAAGVVFNAVQLKSPAEVFTSASSGIYTCILGIGYVLLAVWAFGRRKSESAGYSAPNRKIQAVYRIIVSSVICLLPGYLVFDQIVLEKGRYLSADAVFWIIVLYLTAVFVYFLYELITTKSIKRLKQSIPGLGILAGVHVLILVIATAGNTFAKNKTYEADDIRYITYQGDPNEYYYDLETEYIKERSAGVKLDSAVLKEIVAEQYRETADLWKRDSNSYYSTAAKMQYIGIGIGTGNGTAYRNIMLTNEQMKTFIGELEQNEEFRKIYTELPDLNNRAHSIRDDRSYITSEDKLIQVYEAVQKDIDEMTFEEWFYILSESRYEESEQIALTELRLELTVGNQVTILEIPIYTSMKHAASKYMELVDWTKRQDELAKKLQNLNLYEELYISIEVYTPEGEVLYLTCDYNVYDTYASIKSRDQAQQHARDLGEVLQKSVGESIDFDKAYMRISTSGDEVLEDGVDWGWYNHEAYLQVDIEELPEFFRNQLTELTDNEESKVVAAE